MREKPKFTESKMVKIKHFFWITAIAGLIFNPSFFSKSELAAASHLSAPISVKTASIKVIQAEASSTVVAENNLLATAINGNCLAPQAGPNDLLYEQGMF